MKIKAYFKNGEYGVLFNERADDTVLADEAVVTTANKGLYIWIGFYFYGTFYT